MLLSTCVILSHMVVLYDRCY